VPKNHQVSTVKRQEYEKKNTTEYLGDGGPSLKTV